MSLIFCDSFDHYSALGQKWDTVNSDVGGDAPSISSSAARTGSHGMDVPSMGQTSSSNFGYAQKNLANQTSYILGMAIYIPIGQGLVNINTRVVDFMDGATIQIELDITPDGHITIFRNATLLATSTAAISFGAWHYLEVKTLIDPTAGTIAVKVDGSTVMNLTGQNTKGSSTNNIGSIIIGTLTSVGSFHHSFHFYVDDLYIADTNGSHNNDFVGDVAVRAVLPTGNSATTNQYTRGGTDLGSNYKQVYENPPDDDTTYVTDATVADQDRYVYPAISASAVFALVVNLRARKDDAGTRSVRAVTESGGTVGDNGSDFALSTSYQDFQGIFETDPHTSSPWTQSGVNNAEFGIKTTA